APRAGGVRARRRTRRLVLSPSRSPHPGDSLLSHKRSRRADADPVVDLLVDNPTRDVADELCGRECWGRSGKSGIVSRLLAFRTALAAWVVSRCGNCASGDCPKVSAAPFSHAAVNRRVVVRLLQNGGLPG